MSNPRSRGTRSHAFAPPLYDSNNLPTNDPRVTGRLAEMNGLMRDTGAGWEYVGVVRTLTSFGVVSGGTFNATAWQNALDTVGALKGTLIIPEGTFNVVPGELTINYSGLTIEGVGDGSIIAPTSYIGHLFTATGKDNITVKNIKIQGTAVVEDADPDHWRAFYFEGCSNCNIEGVHNNLTPGGIVFVATNANPNCDYNHIVNNTFDDVGYCGIEVKSDNDTGTQGNRSVKGNVIQGNICINNESDDGDTPVGRGYGIVVGYWAEENTITGNVCSNNSHHGIYLRTHAIHNTVTGNTVCDNQGTGITLFLGPSGNIVDGNFCWNNARTYGEGNIGVQYSDSHGATANVISNNICLESMYNDQGTNDGGNGIYVRGGKRTVIQGNICGRNGRAGIMVVPDQSGTLIGDNLIEGNFCYDNDFANTTDSDLGGNVTSKYAAGIVLYGASLINTVVRGNYCYNTESAKYQKYGIWIHSGATTGYISGNYVFNNRTGGIQNESTATGIITDFNPGAATTAVIASSDATVTVPTLRITDTKGYSGTTATPGSIAGALEFYSLEDSSGYPAVAGAIKSVIETTLGTGRGVGVFTNSASATPTQNLYVSAAGNVVCNSAAIATDATDGFLYIPSCAGTPTGTPTTYTGRVAMVFDTTGNKLYVYDGGWIDVT